MTNGPDRWSTISQLADLARDTDDAPTRARLLDAIEAQAAAGASDGPRAPSWGERLAASAPDTLAVVGLLALGALGTLEGTTAAALALAVLTGRLSPTAPRIPGRGPHGGPPSTGGGGGAAAALGASFVAGTLPALAAHVLRAEPPPEREPETERQPGQHGERDSLHA